jgi:hypothetical protein
VILSSQQEPCEKEDMVLRSSANSDCIRLANISVLRGLLQQQCRGCHRDVSGDCQCNFTGVFTPGRGGPGDGAGARGGPLPWQPCRVMPSQPCRVIADYCCEDPARPCPGPCGPAAAATTTRMPPRAVTRGETTAPPGTGTPPPSDCGFYLLMASHRVADSSASRALQDTFPPAAPTRTT